MQGANGNGVDRLAPDPAEIERALGLLVEPGATFEVRVLGGRRPRSGYFRDAAIATQAIIKERGREGIYITLNPIDPRLHARAAERIIDAQSGGTTGDTQIVRRRRLLVDCDAIRPSGISATDAEHDLAIARAQEIAYELGQDGWPDPLVGDSGNGGHLVYAIDLPTDDGGVVARCLAALATRFNCERVKIDGKVSNAARISKVFGTVARKGDSTVERPHRMARILSAPESLDVVPTALLEALAGPAPSPPRGNGPPGNGRRSWDLESWITEHLPEARGPKPWEGGRKWVLRTCPFHSDHDRGEAFVVELADGGIAAGCQHESCTWNWRDLRERFGPGAYERGSHGPGFAHDDRDPREDPPPAGEADPPPGYSVRDESGLGDTSPPADPLAGCSAVDLVDVIIEYGQRPRVKLFLPDAKDARPAARELLTVRAGALIVLIGPTGGAKTSTLLEILRCHATYVGAAGYVGLEHAPAVAASRLVGQHHQRSWLDAPEMSREDIATALRGLERLYFLPRLTLDEIFLRAEAILERHAPAPLLLGIDYAQIAGDIAQQAGGERVRLAQIIERIARWAESRNVVVILNSQSSRAGSKELASGDLVGADTTGSAAETAQVERAATVTLALGQIGEKDDGHGWRSLDLSLGKVRVGRGDQVAALRYHGESGRVEHTGTMEAASDVRERRKNERTGSAAKETDRKAEDFVREYLARQEHPVPRTWVEKAGSSVRTTSLRAAIERLIDTGEIEEAGPGKRKNERPLIRLRNAQQQQPTSPTREEPRGNPEPPGDEPSSDETTSHDVPHDVRGSGTAHDDDDALGTCGVPASSRTSSSASMPTVNQDVVSPDAVSPNAADITAPTTPTPAPTMPTEPDPWPELDLPTPPVAPREAGLHQDGTDGYDITGAQGPAPVDARSTSPPAAEPTFVERVLATGFAIAAQRGDGRASAYLIATALRCSTDEVDAAAEPLVKAGVLRRERGRWYVFAELASDAEGRR